MIGLGDVSGKDPVKKPGTGGVGNDDVGSPAPDGIVDTAKIDTSAAEVAADNLSAREVADEQLDRSVRKYDGFSAVVQEVVDAYPAAVAFLPCADLSVNRDEPGIGRFTVDGDFEPRFVAGQKTVDVLQKIELAQQSGRRTGIVLLPEPVEDVEQFTL